MKITYDIDKYKEEEKIAVALGFFDGVHLGHKNIIEQMKNIASFEGLKSAVLTFKKHPLNLIFPKYAPKIISSNSEKVNLFKNLSIDSLFFLDFTEEFMNYDPEKFIKEIIVEKLKAKFVFVGFNYTFGYKGIGTPEMLIKFGQKYNFKVVIIPPFHIEKQIVSSSFIRDLVSSGNVNKAKKYLGRNYYIVGQVIHGKGLGSEFSIPTANINIDKSILIPDSGVYYTNVDYKGQSYHGLTNIGHNPTFSNHPFSIETYIYDFNKMIYSEEIKIHFLKKIRGELKFDNIDLLVEQIRKDIDYIRKRYINK